MKFRSILCAGVAALALAACGDKSSDAGGDAKPSNARAASAGAPSPINKPFSLKGGEPLDVEAFFSLMPADARPEYASAEFDDKLGATVITDIKFTEGEAGDTVTIDRAELYGVDIDAINRMNAAEPSIDAPFETLFQKVRLFGVTPNGEGEDADVSLGAVEIDALRVRQGGVGEGSENDSPAVFFNAFELGGLYIKDLTVSAAEIETGSEFAATVPDMRLVGVGGGKLGAMIINGLSYEVLQSDESVASLASLMGPQGALIMDSPLKNFIAPGAQKASIDSFVWKGLDLSGWMDYGLKQENPPYTAKNLVQIGTMELSDLETYVNGKLAYKGETSTIVAEESTWVIPSKIRADSKGDYYDFSAYVPVEEAELQKLIKDNGLDNVKASSTFAWDWNAKKGAAGLKTGFETENLADFSMGFDLSGMEMEKIGAAIDAGDEDAIAKLGAFNGFNMSLKDETLLDVIFAVAGMQMNAPSEQLRQSAPAMLQLGGAQVSALNPRFSGYISALAAFIADGGTLEINASPSEPVPFATLAETGETGPQTLPDVLNLTITHKE
ncbi:MAG: hypothetical protein AAGJ87_11665 [Pseudomonadota bacterium]